MSTFNSGTIDSRLVRTIGMMAGLFFLTWTVAGWVITDNTTYMVLAVMAVLGIAMTMAILRDWRSGLFIFLCWLVLEDMLRKYMGNGLIIFFAKDIILGITYASMLVARRKNQLMTFKPPFIFWLAIFFWLGVVQVFNPHSPHIFFGLLGMKTYFYYVPLMFAGYALLRTEEDLRKVLMLNMWIAIVVAGLGVLQSLGGGGFLNPEGMAPELYDLSHEVRVAPQSGLIYQSRHFRVRERWTIWHVSDVAVHSGFWHCGLPAAASKTRTWARNRFRCGRSCCACKYFERVARNSSFTW